MRPRQACLGILCGHAGPRPWPQASMRPRQACLGIKAQIKVVMDAIKGFNEAEASLPRNLVRGQYRSD